MKNAFSSGELILKPGQLEHGTNQFELECFGIDENNDKVTISHIVNVLYPPSRPQITPVQAVKAGNEQKLTCVSKAGNPTAKLNWYRDTQMIESIYTHEGDIVKAEVTFVAKPEDTGSEFRCEATNSAATKPVSETIIIELLSESTTASEPLISTLEVIKTSESKIETVTPEEYDGYDDSSYEYYGETNGIDETNHPFAHPEEVDYPTIFGGKRKVNDKDLPIRTETQNTAKISNSKTPISNENEVYPKTNYNAVPLYGSNSPATLSLSFSCLILAFFLHH